MVRAGDVYSVANLIAKALGVVPGSEDLWRWEGYAGGDGLAIDKQTSDTEVTFLRKADRKGRITLSNIQPNDMLNLSISKPVVIKTESKRAASVELENDTTVEQSQELTYTFTHGKETIDTVTAGFSVTSETTIGTGEGAAAKFEQKFSATVSSEWTKQTGIRDEEGKVSRFPIVVPPKTKIRAWIEWNESTLRRHIRADASFEAAVKIGKYYKSPKYDAGKARKVNNWHWSGEKYWATLGELASVLEGRGSVKQPLANFFYRNPSKRQSKDYIDRIRNGPTIPFDQVVEYKDADEISVKYETIQTF